MEFLRARSKAEMDSRQEEIVNACDTLYERLGYDGVNFKAIAELTSISRPAIYNYFRTKDEILLALLKREMLRWQSDFLERLRPVSAMTKEQYSACLTEGLTRHAKMFRLIDILFTLLEDNSRAENLADFYSSVSSVFETIYSCTQRYFPDATEQALRRFQYESVSYVLGLHAVTSVSQKHSSAIRLSGVCAGLPRFEQLCQDGLLALLSAL